MDDIASMIYRYAAAFDSGDVEAAIEFFTEDAVFYSPSAEAQRSDGRPHDPIKSQDTTWYGDAIGKWEGDTMVLDVVGFNDESWLGWPGWLHSNNMRVEERFTRNGNTLNYQVTVFDPDTLLEPFKLEPRTLRLNADPKATLIEDLPCEERDTDHIVTHERG